MVRQVFTLNFLDSFIFGLTTVAVPLLMLERNISIAAIGVVFSLAPIAKAIVRLAAAALADSVGERPFYLLNALSNAAQSAAYLFATSPVGFAAGKAIEGARESFIWAVNRSSIMHQQPDKRHFALSSMVSGRSVYFALGSLSVGLLYQLGGFEAALLLCAIIGLAMAFLSFSVKDTPHRNRLKLSDFSIFGREKRFYLTLVAMTCGSTFYVVILYLLIPLLFKLSGFSNESIAIIYAAYFLVFGLMMNVLSHSKITAKRSAYVGTAIFAISLFAMSFTPSDTLPFFFILMAVGDAHLGVLWEEIIYLQAFPSARRATEVALLHLPSGFTIFLASAASGFVVERSGFAPLFVLGAVSLVAFSWLSLLACGKRA